MFVRTKAVVALLAAGTIVLAGCAGEAEKQDADVLTLLRTNAAESLQTALEKTEKAESAKVTIEGKSGGEPFNGKGSIAYGDTPRAAMVIEDPEDGPTELRILPGAIYVGIGEKERADYDGKEWLKIDMAAAAKASKSPELADASAEFSKQLRSLDPTVQIQRVIAGGAFKVAGEEKVDGARTIHYAGTVPTATYFAGETDLVSKAEKATFTKAGITEVKIDVWVDEKYQPRRLKVVAGAIEDHTITFSEYGKPVEIVEPPAEKCADFAKMLAELAKLRGELGDLQG